MGLQGLFELDMGDRFSSATQAGGGHHVCEPIGRASRVLGKQVSCATHSWLQVLI